MRSPRPLLLVLLALVPSLGHAAAAVEYVDLPGGTFLSVLAYEDMADGSRVAPFRLATEPVSNGEFLRFVQAHPQWRRDRVPRLFADAGYLSHWAEPDALGDPALVEQPVTRVSWFAADAYCQAQGARLPTWLEWEFAAAADETRPDARQDPAWRERLLSWYARPATAVLPPVGQTPRNYYGVRDLHGLVWEWAEDYAAMLVSSDNREQSAADRLRFCGAAALSMRDRENYAVMMRIALLSALSAEASTRSLGFRCAKDIEEK